jgi:hypothetical protein
MIYDRFLDKGKKPKIEVIEKNLGDKLSLWVELREYLDNRYDFTNEFIFFTKKYGWSYRYKRKGRTMLYLFPEQGAFSILIVLGMKESDEANEIRDQLNEQIRSIFDGTEQLHDGRWLWIRILSKSDLDSLKILLSAKQKPLKK